MKRFLLHFSMAAAVTLVTLALAPSVRAQQQADQDPAAATPHRADTADAPQTQQNEAQMPASGETTTQDAKTFSGVIAKENGDLILKDPVTKVSYKLDDPSKAKQYMGKQVKVSGKLNINSNTIQVNSIEPIR
jgi:glucose/arabinose dehydrogenase